MSISFTCDACGKRYKVGDQLAGKRVKCKICGGRMQVPELPGSPDDQILRHQPREREFELAIGDSEAIEQISAHIAQHVGPVEGVLHELISDLVHIDIHCVAPTPERPFHTLVTSGMSDKPMTVPPGAEEFRYAELMLCLPADWPMEHDDFEDEANYWPIRSLKFLARLPHEYETWLGFGHTVPNGDPPEPFAENTKLCCCLVVPPVTVPEAFHQLWLSDDKIINFYAVLPLYAEEVDFKLKHGAEKLLERFDKLGVNEVLEIRRKNACKRGLWPF
jgi:hypothetical protein